MACIMQDRLLYDYPVPPGKIRVDPSNYFVSRYARVVSSVCHYTRECNVP